MDHFMAFGGAVDRAAALRRQFLRGGADPQAVRFGEPEGAAVYVHVAGDGEADEALRRARRLRVPVVVVQIPELEPVIRAVAHRLGEDGPPLAARVPILRAAVCDRLVAIHARRAALARGGSVLMLSPLVLGIAEAYGEETGAVRLPELAAALGAGIACERLAEKLEEKTPVAGRAMRAVVAYAATRAIGEAVQKRFALAASAASPPGLTPPRAAAVPVAP